MAIDTVYVHGPTSRSGGAYHYECHGYNHTAKDKMLGRFESPSERQRRHRR